MAASEGGVPSLATFLEVTTLGAESLPTFALGYDDGRVDCHAFAAAFAKQQDANELKVLHEIIGVASRASLAY